MVEIYLFIYLLAFDTRMIILFIEDTQIPEYIIKILQFENKIRKTLRIFWEMVMCPLTIIE